MKRGSPKTSKNLVRTGKQANIPARQIEQSILLYRGQKVVMDTDLAALYGVETRVLIQAAQRNINRFPADFMTQLTRKDFDLLRSQTVTSRKWGGRRNPPYAFTEQGISMLSSVLKSPRAIKVSIEIIRTYVRLRNMIASNALMSRNLETMEKRYDSQFKKVFKTIQKLKVPRKTKRRVIGFRVRKK